MVMKFESASVGADANLHARAKCGFWAEQGFGNPFGPYPTRHRRVPTTSEEPGGFAALRGARRGRPASGSLWCPLTSRAK